MHPSRTTLGRLSTAHPEWPCNTNEGHFNSIQEPFLFGQLILAQQRPVLRILQG